MIEDDPEEEAPSEEELREMEAAWERRAAARPPEVQRALEEQIRATTNAIESLASPQSYVQRAFEEYSKRLALLTPSAVGPRARLFAESMASLAEVIEQHRETIEQVRQRIERRERLREARKLPHEKRAAVAAALLVWGDLDGRRDEYEGEEPSRELLELARATLEHFGTGENGWPDDKEGRDSATDRLARELLSAIPAMLDAVGTYREPDTRVDIERRWAGTAEELREASTAAEDRMLWADARFLRHLSTVGPMGQRMAREGADDARARYAEHNPGNATLPGVNPYPGEIWKAWEFKRPAPEATDRRHEPPIVFRVLARAVWLDRVRPGLERHQVQRRQNAGVTAIPDLQLGLLDRIIHPGEQRIVPLRDGRGRVVSGEVRDDNGRLVATIPELDAGTMLAIEREMKLLHSVHGQRFFRWLLHGIWRQWAEFNPRPEEIWFSDGGMSVLADRLECSRRDDFRKVLDAGRRVRVPMADGWINGLWTYREFRHAPGRPGRLRFNAAPEFVPSNKVWEQLERVDSYLVPIPAPGQEPALVGGAGTHGAQLAAQVRYLRAIRLRAVELHDEGGVKLSEREWLDISIGLSADLAERMRAAWLEGNDGRPPFAALQGNRWTLAPAFSDLLAFILRGGKKSIAGKVGGDEAAERAAQREARAVKKWSRNR